MKKYPLLKILTPILVLSPLILVTNCSFEIPSISISGSKNCYWVQGETNNIEIQAIGYFVDKLEWDYEIVTYSSDAPEFIVTNPVIKDNTISTSFILESDTPYDYEDNKKFDLVIRVYDKFKTFLLQYTSEYKFFNTINQFIEQEITVSTQEGIAPSAFYKGPLKTVGNYNTVGVISDYMSSAGLPIAGAMNLRNIINADVANTIDKVIENFRYCFTPMIQLNFDQVKINFSYKYDFINGVFEYVEINGKVVDTSLLNTSATFSTKFENCKLVGAYASNNSNGAPHTQYKGDTINANILSFAPNNTTNSIVKYDVAVVCDTIGYGIYYDENYFLNNENGFFGIEKFDTHGNNRGFCLESYYLSKIEGDSKVNIVPIDIATLSNPINFSDLYLTNEWINNESKLRSTRAQFFGQWDAPNDGFASDHVMDTNYCNYNGKNETFNWKHSIYEFINCFPDAKTGSEAVNSFKKQITINGRIYNWYELFNLIRVPGDGSQQIQFFLNSCFTYGGARSVTENCEFLYLP